MNDIYDLKNEPSGAQYQRLVEFASPICTAFVLVLRHEDRVRERARSVLANLQPYLLRTEEAGEWPGTKLPRGTAQVFHFRLNRHSAEILKGSASHLFEWLQPNLPEDLSFLRDDGSAWLTTISHEKQAYFKLSPEEARAIRRTLPELEVQERFPKPIN